METNKNIFTWTLAFALLLALPFGSLAQEDDDSSKSDLGQKTQNPLADMIMVPIQNNFTFDNTQNDGTGYTMNLQPVFPVKAGNLSIINRVTLGFGYMPGLTAGGPELPAGAPDDGRTDGVWGGLDLNWTAYFTPPPIGDFSWGVGPAINFPIASDNRLGSGKWSLGPSLVFVWQPGKWTIDAIFRQIWSVAGNEERVDVNQFYLQLLVAYNLSNGWALATMPVLTSNWDRDEGEKWLIPIGGGVNKIFYAGKMPMLAMCHYYYHLEKPTLGPSSELRFQLNLIISK